MRRQLTIFLSIIATAAVVIAVIVVIARGSNTPRAITTAASTTTAVAPSSSSTSPKLVPIRGSKGDPEVFSASGTATSQGTGQIPPGMVVTLYYACLGTAELKISVGGSPLLTAPCLNEVYGAEVPSASSPRDVVVTSPTTDRWRVVAYQGSPS
jgi:hypothetical protein